MWAGHDSAGGRSGAGGSRALSNGIGGFGGYLGWIVTYISTVAIFMSLLEMDYFEVVVCSAIIFVFRFIGFFLMFGLLGGLGVHNLPSAGFGSGGGRVMLSGDIDQEDDESLDGVRARESDAAMSDLLLYGGVEAKTWMEKSPSGILAGKTHDQSVRLLRSFYDAGTLEIRVYPHKNAKGVDSVNRMIVVPPRTDAPGAKDVRVRVMKEMKSLANDLGRVAPRNRGEKYWPVKMLTDEEEEKEFAEPSLPGKSGASPDEDKDDDN